MSIPENYDSADDFGVVRKLTSGKVDSIHLGDIAATGNTALGLAGNIDTFIPGAGDLVGNSTAIGAGFTGIEEYYRNKQKRKEIAENFDVDNIRQTIRQNRNPALAKSLDKEVDWLGFVANAGAAMGGVALGGTAGALVATAFFFPVLWIAAPVLSIAGAMVGGGVANSMYKTAFEKQEQDPIVINMQINKIHKENGYVPPEIVFAALAANLPEKSGKKADKLLDKYTGTKLFTEALSDHNNIPMLTAMMHDPVTEIALRREYKLPPDLQNPAKTVAEQYADMINSGQMKPQNLLNKDEGVYVMMAMARAQEQGIDVPNTPDAKQNRLERA
ncbi:MAG: hypothetical protein AABY33_07575 [Pseudomonadota bacterium]